VTARVRIGTAGWVVVALVTALVVSFLVVKPWQAEAAPGDDDSTFVPITPCRLFDFRAGANNVGPKNTPLGTKVAYTQPVVGTNGRCSIPADAVGVAMNVTIVSPSAQSNLRVYPADAALPATSNLNWLPGQSPTPNKVDVKLSADGKIKLYNHAGTVDVLGDVVGYYSNKSLKELAARPQVPFFHYLDVGQEQVIGTVGPLSLVMECADLGGGMTRVRILGRTTANGSVIMEGFDNFTGATNAFLLTTTPADDREMFVSSATGTFVGNHFDHGALMTPNGHYIAIDGETQLFGVNYGARDCVAIGHYIFQDPSAP
jgi:hypothetical protein